MDKKNIISDMDELAIAKKNGSIYMKLIIAFAGIVVIASLGWSFSVINSAMDKILVVDKSGEYLKTVVEDKEKLFMSLISSHCAQTVYYANSFDRLSIKENQTKAFFLASADNLNRIFAKYTQDRAYGDAIDRGVVYKCEFKKFMEMKGENEPYHVVFASELSIIDVFSTKKILIISSGDIIKTKPQFPENVTGFYFKNYNQEYQLIPDEK